jgi:hypothetical protein
MTPYPARRNYPWLRLKDMPYDSAERLFKGMQRQTPQAKNPARHRAFTLLLEALDTLNHRGVDYFPPAKLHALLIAAAAEAGWYTDPTKYRKKRQPAPSGMRHCVGCDQVLPEQTFRIPMSQRELARNKALEYAPDTVKRDKMSHLCTDCRHKKQQAKHKREQRAAITHAIKTFESNPTKAGAYGYYSALINRIAATTEASLRKAKGKDYAEAFYKLKLEMLRRARVVLDTLLEEERLHEIELTEYTIPCWSQFLPKAQREALQQAHAHYAASAPIGSRMPALYRGRAT